MEEDDFENTERRTILWKGLEVKLSISTSYRGAFYSCEVEINGSWFLSGGHSPEDALNGLERELRDSASGERVRLTRDALDEARLNGDRKDVGFYEKVLKEELKYQLDALAWVRSDEKSNLPKN